MCLSFIQENKFTIFAAPFFWFVGSHKYDFHSRRRRVNYASDRLFSETEFVQFKPAAKKIDIRT